MTETTTTTELRLVRLLDTYPVFDRWAWLRGRDEFPTGDETVFYARPSRDMGDGWSVLVVPSTDPRHDGMWTMNGPTYGLPETPEGADRWHGWNVETRYLEDVEPEETPTVTPVSDIRPGTIVTADNPAGRRVWLYVVVPTGPDTAYGVNLGTSLTGSRYPDESYGTGLSWITGTGIVPEYGVRTLGDLSGEQTEALASFLRSHGLSLPADTEGASEGHSGPSEAEVREEVTRELTARFESWKSSLVSDAHEFADENDLCGEFDRFMREHGLSERTRSYEVSWTATITVSGSTVVEGSGRDDAMESFDCDPSAYVGTDNLVELIRYGSPDVDIESDDVEVYE